MIDADDGHADRPSATPFELDYLIAKIVDHAINLLDHGLGQHLHLDADLHGRNRPSTNEIARIRQGGFTRNDFPKRAVAATRFNATPLVLDIQDAVPPVDGSLPQLRRAIDLNQVFVEMHCYEVALV